MYCIAGHLHGESRVRGHRVTLKGLQSGCRVVTAALTKRQGTKHDCRGWLSYWAPRTTARSTTRRNTNRQTLLKPRILLVWSRGLLDCYLVEDLQTRRARKVPSPGTSLARAHSKDDKKLKRTLEATPLRNSTSRSTAWPKP